MRHDHDGVVVGILPDPMLLAEPADFGHVRLDVINSPAFDPWKKTLSAGQAFAAGDLDRRMAGQLNETIQIIRAERFLKPDHTIVSEHFCLIQGPLVTVRPIRIGSTGIDHQFAILANRLASGAHNCLIGLRIPTTKRPPTDLERAEAAAVRCLKLASHLFRLLHQHRSIRLDPVAKPAAQQAPDRLTRDFSEDVPERHVDATDRVRDTAAAALPKGVLVQHLGGDQRINGACPLVKRSQQLKRGFHQRR